jgi:hypothetical protein
MKVLLLHLDLGIGGLLLSTFLPFRLLITLGGAERLMVNLALAMQDLGHEIKIFTSHHDVKRCFQETTQEGECPRLGTSFSSCRREIREHHRGTWRLASETIFWQTHCILCNPSNGISVCDGNSHIIPT